jgi:DNA-binding FadR family transcriptional regulator
MVSSSKTLQSRGDSYQPQYELIAEKIAYMILQSHLKSGDRLPTEQQLGEQFGVSRSIVREAIKVLTATGLVNVRKGVGIYVTREQHPLAKHVLNLAMLADPQEIDALFAFRSLQEVMTTRLAIEQITLAEMRTLEEIIQRNLRSAEQEDWDTYLESDAAFHRGIALATHNPYFVETITNVLTLQESAIRLLRKYLPNTLRASAQQHLVVFECIKCGDAEGAAQNMKQHIDTVLAAYQQEVRVRIARDLLGD